MAIFTYYCALLLIEVKGVVKANSYPDIGFKCFGTKGKVFVDIILVLSQFGFCCAYIYFIVENLFVLIVNAQTWETEEIKTEMLANIDPLNPTRLLLSLFCVVMYSLLSFVRNIQVFSKFHLWAITAIVITCSMCIVAGAMELHDFGN